MHNLATYQTSIQINYVRSWDRPLLHVSSSWLILSKVATFQAGWASSVRPYVRRDDHPFPTHQPNWNFLY
jgi:hypothetical protein